MGLQFRGKIWAKDIHSGFANGRWNSMSWAGMGSPRERGRAEKTCPDGALGQSDMQRSGGKAKGSKKNQQRSLGRDRQFERQEENQKPSEESPNCVECCKRARCWQEESGPVSLIADQQRLAKCQARSRSSHICEMTLLYPNLQADYLYSTFSL